MPGPSPTVMIQLSGDSRPALEGARQLILDAIEAASNGGAATLSDPMHYAGEWRVVGVLQQWAPS